MSEIVEQSPKVPTLAYDIASAGFDIAADDIRPPKLYIGQSMSAAVQNGIAQLGDVFLANGAEDPDAQVLWSQKQGGDGVLAHPLALTRGKSYSDPSTNELLTWSVNDPAAHPDAWTTYTFTLALPEVDPYFPVKFLLTKSGQPTAQAINTVIAKAAVAGDPPYARAFRITAVLKSTKNGQKYAVAQAKLVAADAANVEVAERMASVLRDDAEAATPVAQLEGPAI